MANVIKLESYTFKVRKGNKKKHFTLDDIDNNFDFFDFFLQYINSFNKKLEVDDKLKKALLFNSDSLNIDKNNRRISGLVESGEYGVKSKIINTITKQKTYDKKETDSDIQPFYFLVKIPANGSIGFVILQRTGIHGINTIFKNHLKSYCRGIYTDLIIELSPLIQKEVIEQLITDGGIREFILRRYMPPTDASERLGLKEFNNDIKLLEFKIIAKKNKFINRNKAAKNFINNPNIKLIDLSEINKLGFDGAHKTSIRIIHNGTPRTIDLSDTGRVLPYYDIDHEVEKNAGIPNFDSINAIAINYVESLYRDLYLIK